DPTNVAVVPATDDGALFTYLSVCNVNEEGTAFECTQDQETIDDVGIATDTFGPSVFLADRTPRLPFVAPFSGALTVVAPTVPSEPLIYAIRWNRTGIISVRDCRVASCTLTDDLLQVQAGESITFELVTESGTSTETSLTVYYDPNDPLTAPLVRR